MAVAIAAALAEADPANAAAYTANAERIAADLDALDRDLAAMLAPVADRPAIVFHDAYQYLENRYGLSIVGAVTISPDVAPGAQRVAELQETVAGLGATCLFAEPQFTPQVLEVVAEGTGAQIAVLDPLGADIAPGADLYATLLRRNARALADCLGG